MDGSSSPVAVLKNSSLPPGETFTAPTVYSVTRLDNRFVTGTHLSESDGDTVMPTPAELADSNSSTDASTYYGCFIGHNAVAEGVQDLISPVRWTIAIQLGDGVAVNNVVEALSQQQEGPAGKGGPCSPRTLAFPSGLQPHLWPPMLPGFLLQTNPSILRITLPLQSVPGYTLMAGKGLFTAGRFNCSGTLRPEIQECVLQMPPEQAAAHCNADPECKAFVLKQQGVFGSGSSLAIFKHDANESAILFNPTGLLYLRNDPAAPDSSSGGLSGAAVAGIAVGSTVAAAAMAGLFAAALLRHRRRRRALGAPKAYASLSSSTVLPVAVIGGPGPSHSLSAELASHTASADPAHADSPFAAAAAVVPAFDPAPDGPAAPTAMQPRAGSTAPRPAAGPALHLAASSALLDGPGGRVFKAKLRGEIIAVKEIDLGASEANRRTFLTEAVQLQRLRHAAVVGFVGVGVRNRTGLLLMEYCEGRDLYT
ncbi:hypothetical protein COHA_005863 [Chlorella ohadii]|nr:hypothetical protein COHA_005863 [Chlorella ohadii]